MKISELRVLVIDDHATMRNMVQGCFSELGCKNIHQAGDGDAAWTEIVAAAQAQSPYNFISCDWNMPKMSGIALLKKFRNHPDFKKIPFLMVTAENKRENIMEAMNAGVSNYIVKPFSAATLREKIKKIIPGIILPDDKL